MDFDVIRVEVDFKLHFKSGKLKLNIMHYNVIKMAMDAF